MAAMHRALTVGCAVTLCVAACGGDGAKAAPNAVDVVVAPVQVRDVPIVVEWAAQTFGANDIEIRARVKGFLTSKVYKEGSVVARRAAVPDRSAGVPERGRAGARGCE